MKACALRSKAYALKLYLFEKRVTLELTVCDYDRIGTSDPIGKVSLGYNRKGAELKHWKEMVENPRRPVIHWHVLKVQLCMTERLIFFFSFFLSRLPSPLLSLHVSG